MRVSLRCASSETKRCNAAYKLTALGTAAKRGLTFAAYKGTIKPGVTTVLRSSVSAKNKKALKRLKSVKVRLSVTMSAAGATSVTRRWDLKVAVTS